MYEELSAKAECEVLIAFDSLGIYGLHSRLNTPYAVLSTERAV